MKQISSILILSVNGGDRISVTYDVIDADSGRLIDSNIKENFFAVNPSLHEHVEAIRDYIRTNQLGE